jgi:hypothetical protein
MSLSKHGHCQSVAAACMLDVHLAHDWDRFSMHRARADANFVRVLSWYAGSVACPWPTTSCKAH